MIKLNRDVFQKDPSTSKLANEGVANVNDDKTRQAMAVLRYELETFVCDGQYEKGMAHIFDTYLSNINQPQQPAVWVSGFYGSGKSHLVKMLRALWDDTVFEDGATARGMANLPQNITDSLTELSAQGKRHGGLHAASGTLGAGASGSVRLALLRIIFKSAGLPDQYPIARFVMWLKSEGIHDQVQSHVEKSGLDWNEELDNFYVAEGLHNALVHTKPNLFPSPASCVKTLNNLYPYVKDVSSDDMIKSIHQALTKDGKFPLTLVVLDEVQQYIGGDTQRSIDVQEVVEACSQRIGGKLLFIATGQTAVTGTSNLKKLEGRFTIRVELSDADVESVIRKVILAKKPEAKVPIEQVMETNLGEISKHLAGTSIGHRQDDIPNFPQDYPILPVRNRFWENTLRALDQTGTDSQLRNQLSMVHKVIQTNLDAPLGHVVPADFLYFDSADKLLQARILPRKVHEKTISWYSNGTSDEKLMARACGLIFLINRLRSRGDNKIGIRATIDTLANLMVEDIAHGSGTLHNKLSTLLNGCELLMKIGDEYRIQTEESAVWTNEFQSQRSILSNKSHSIDGERESRIRKMFEETIGKLSLTQGTPKVPRKLHLVFEGQLPGDAEERICVWIRNGWSSNENTVQIDSRLAGSQSPTIFVFLPSRSADSLRQQIIEYRAASATLNIRGIPDSPEGIEARSAMESTRQTAEDKIHDLLQEAFSNARVFQGGGNEILGTDLKLMVTEAAGNSMLRLYPQFHFADHKGWSRVYERARKGAPDALRAVGVTGEPSSNQVCKTILRFIGSGKQGAQVRSEFESPPYGWSGDAVDGGLQVLLVAGQIRAQDERGQPIAPRELDRRAIGKVRFRVESTVVSTPQRVQLRMLFQKVGINFKQGEELISAPRFLEQVLELAKQAGGEAPKPTRPDTEFIDQIRTTAGNEQLIAIFNKRNKLGENIEKWQKLGNQIHQQLPKWNILKDLARHAANLQGAIGSLAQIETVENQRQLLETPNPIPPLTAQLTQLLRDELNRLTQQYESLHKEGMERLKNDINWQKLQPNERHQLLAEQHLHEAARPKAKVQTTRDVLDTLDNYSLSQFVDRVAAIPARFDQVARKAAEMCEPKAQLIQVPRATLRSETEIQEWIDQVKQQLKNALKEGPVVIK